MTWTKAHGFNWINWNLNPLSLSLSFIFHCSLIPQSHFILSLPFSSEWSISVYFLCINYTKKLFKCTFLNKMCAIDFLTQSGLSTADNPTFGKWDCTESCKRLQLWEVFSFFSDTHWPGVTVFSWTMGLSLTSLRWTRTVLWPSKLRQALNR